MYSLVFVLLTLILAGDPNYISLSFKSVLQQHIALTKIRFQIIVEIMGAYKIKIITWDGHHVRIHALK